MLVAQSSGFATSALRFSVSWHLCLHVPPRPETHVASSLLVDVTPIALSYSYEPRCGYRKPLDGGDTELNQFVVCIMMCGERIKMFYCRSMNCVSESTGVLID